MEKSKIDIVVENLMSIHPLLYRTLSRSVRTKTSLTPGGMFVIGFLKRQGSQTMSDIGKYLSMPKPHVTLLVDKLSSEGLVVRQNDPNDRRVFKIALTEKGHNDFEGLKKVVSEGLKEILLHLEEDEMNLLVSSSQHVKDILISTLTEV